MELEAGRIDLWNVTQSDGAAEDRFTLLSKNLSIVSGLFPVQSCAQFTKGESHL